MNIYEAVLNLGVETKAYFPGWDDNIRLVKRDGCILLQDTDTYKTYPYTPKYEELISTKWVLER